MEDIQFTKNFRLEEFLRSETAKKYGIKNEPTEQVVNNLKYLCEQCLQPMRDHFGTPILITSGYRCPELNKMVGSTSRSFHAIGCAADLKFKESTEYSLKDIFEFFHKREIYTELIAEELPHGWIHVAIQKGREQEHQLKYKLSGQSVKRADYQTILKIIGK